MRIGELAHQAGVTVDTVRFYERRGLLPPPSRALSGYRRYSPHALTRILFIGEAKRLGFTLGEIDQLLGRHLDCEGLRARADGKLADIERRILQLRGMRQALRRLTRACETRRPSEGCPVRRALDEVVR